MIHRLPEAFSQNRSEETSEDKWAEFVVPRFIDDLEIKNQRKAWVIVGGRGCGKTTLLRYFCHPTQFSPRRPEIGEPELRHIGLYWRADTNFLNSFAGGDQSSTRWRSAFEHLLACELGKEILRSLKTLNCNPIRQEMFGGLGSLDLSSLRQFDDSLGNSVADLELALQRSRNNLASWVNNLDTWPAPTFLPATTFLLSLVSELQKQLPYLEFSTFAVFIDEYENLREEQQQFINGLLKHGTPPLLFNIAMKRNGWQTRRTLGQESIEDISDYRELDLEEKLSETFELFSAELLFFRLADHRPDLLESIPIVPEQLRSIESIKARYDDPDYRSRVLTAAELMLPRVSEYEAAALIMSDNRLRQKLHDKLSTALKNRGVDLSADALLDDDIPWASVLMPALVSRPREDINVLMSELNELRDGKVNRLSHNQPLVSNNLFGCVNSVYLDAQRSSILFSGFTALTLIARNNVRHFLELAHRIFKAHERHDGDHGKLPVISTETQATAVREASESILGKVKGHGTYGPQLYAMAHTLGSIFRARHRGERQSEPEINHFTLATGDMEGRLHDYLAEAEKWSVLFRERETKMKSTSASSSDYVLNPIFSPHFQISFRKKRSLQVSGAQLLLMLEGDQRERDQMVRDLGKRGADSDNLDLFGEPI